MKLAVLILIFIIGVFHHAEASISDVTTHHLVGDIKKSAETRSSDSNALRVLILNRPGHVQSAFLISNHVVFPGIKGAAISQPIYDSGCSAYYWGNGISCMSLWQNARVHSGRQNGSRNFFVFRKNENSEFVFSYDGWDHSRIYDYQIDTDWNIIPNFIYKPNVLNADFRPMSGNEFVSCKFDAFAGKFRLPFRRKSQIGGESADYYGSEGGYNAIVVNNSPPNPQYGGVGDIVGGTLFWVWVVGWGTYVYRSWNDFKHQGDIDRKERAKYNRIKGLF